MVIADLVHTRVTCTRYRQRMECEDKELVEQQLLRAYSWCFQEVKKRDWKLAM